MRKNKEDLLVFVGGISGSGKTTLVSTTSKHIAGSRTLHSSRAMIDFFGLQSYSELANTSNEEQYIARHKIFKEFKKLGGIGLSEGHYLLFDRGNKPIVTVDEEWRQDVDVFVHLVVDPLSLLSRISKDHSAFTRRIQNQLSIGNDPLAENIKRSQELSIEAAQNIAQNAGKPLEILSNNEALHTAVAGLTEIVNTYRER